MSSNNDLINDDLEILDFKNDIKQGPLIDSEEHSDPNELYYKINANVKSREELINSDTILSVRNLKQFFFFGRRGLFGKRLKNKAVNNVSFDVKTGECFGLVGESGCGKTTTGRSLIRLYDITSGAVYYRGYRISAGTRWNEKEIKYTKLRLKEFSKDPSNTPEQIQAKKAEANKIISDQKSKIKQIKFDNSHVSKKLLTEIQMIFQDPIDSLDPRMTVGDIIAEGLVIQGFKNKEENHKKVVEMLEKVGLVAEHASRYPHEFSGGQRQRIGIARAIIMNPKVLICDEPISALDVSVRAQVLNLLNDLKEELGLTLLFVAHDLSVVKYFCDRIAVMYAGKIVELATSEELFKNPLHPYTKSLLSAIPKPDPISEKTRTRTAYNPGVHDYSEEKPDLREVSPGHMVYCNSFELEQYQAEVEENKKKAETKAKEPKKVENKVEDKKETASKKDETPKKEESPKEVEEKAATPNSTTTTEETTSTGGKRVVKKTTTTTTTRKVVK